MEAPVFDPATDLPIYTGTGGSEAPAMSDEGGCACCDSSTTSHICGSDSTCNKWCFPDKKEISQAECCACQCSGRRGAPPGYHWTIGPVSLRSGRTAVSEDPDNHDFITVDSAGPFTFTDCNSQQFIGFTFEREFYNPDGSLNHIDTTHFDDGIVGAGVSYGVVGCGKVHFTASASFAATGEGQGGAHINSDFPICDGGGTTLTQDVLGGGVINFITSGGSVAFVPACTDCSGVPLQTNDGGPASVCASDLNYSVEYWDGASWITETGTLNKTKTCQWDGGTNVLIVVNTNATQNLVGGNKCCPDCDCNKCKPDGTPDCNAGCQTCWKVSLANNDRGVSYSEMLGTGACPPTGSLSLFLSTDFRNLTLTFGTKCETPAGVVSAMFWGPPLF